MAGTLLPLIEIRRVLVPGTAATLPVARVGLRAGVRVVAKLGPREGPLRATGAVGTLARLDGVQALAEQVALVRLVGERLVRIERVSRADAGWWAEFSEVEGEVGEACGLVTAAEGALRRYLAARAEAGEGGDVYLHLSRDPVTASHEVASYLRVSWPEVQDVLEAGGAGARLRRAMAVMERETGLLRRLLGGEGE